MKKCRTCQIEKEELCFRKYRSSCIECEKQYQKEYTKNNKQKISQNKKQYYIKNKDEINEKKKQYYSLNKDKNFSYRKIYYISNKSKIRIIQNNYEKNRKIQDPAFRLRKIISSHIRKCIKSKDKSYIKYLPYTIQELKQHLESQWESWMTWDNYGVTNLKFKTWQIDHIIPQSLLPYTSMEDENFKQCWSLENLRPLESFENLSKSNKI